MVYYCTGRKKLAFLFHGNFDLSEEHMKYLIKKFGTPYCQSETWFYISILRLVKITEIIHTFYVNIHDIIIVSGKCNI